MKIELCRYQGVMLKHVWFIGKFLCLKLYNLTLLCIYCFAIQLSHWETFKHFKYNSESLNVFETQNILVKLQCNGDILILVTWFNAALIKSWIQFSALSTYKVPFAIGSFRALALVDLTRMKSGAFSPDILPYFGD